MTDRASAMQKALEGVDPISSRRARYRYGYAPAGLLPVEYEEDERAYSHELNRRISLSNSEATDDAP